MIVRERNAIVDIPTQSTKSLSLPKTISDNGKQKGVWTKGVEMRKQPMHSQKATIISNQISQSKFINQSTSIRGKYQYKIKRSKIGNWKQANQKE